MLYSIVWAVLLLGNRLFRPKEPFKETAKSDDASSPSPTAIDHHHDDASLLDEISVLSWNILAPCYGLPHLYRSQKRQQLRNTNNNAADSTTAEDFMEWSYRSPRILETIERHAADLVCLQEVQVDLWPRLGESLQKIGYSTALIQKVNRGLPVATVILLHDRRAREWKAVKVESRSRALLVTLECRKKSRSARQQQDGNNAPYYYLFVANVHLQAGKEEWDTRYSQVKSLLKRLYLHTERASALQLEHPLVLLMGDWNTLTTDPLHNLLTTGTLPDDHGLPQLYPNLPLLPLCDVNQHNNNGNRSPHRQPPLAWTHTCGATLDYIFASPQVQVCELWSADTIAPVSLPIPNANFPSDHVPIGGVFRLHGVRHKDDKNNHKRQSKYG